MPATPKTKPTKIEIKDYRFVYFTYFFKGVDIPLTFAIRLTHILKSDKDALIRMHDHLVGGKVTGVPVRGGDTLCIGNTMDGDTRYINCSSVEAGIQLPVPTGNHSVKDILDANGNFIREQLEINFASIRRVLAVKWEFVSFEILEPGSSGWRKLPFVYTPAEPK